MFLRVNKTTDIEARWNAFFQLYKDDILALHSIQWRDESVYNRSCIQYGIMKYYLAFYLCLLIYIEVINGVSHSWEYYVDKYNLEDITNYLASNNISMTDILDIFGLPIVISSGIGYKEIGLTFNIGEPIESTNINNIDIDVLLSTPIGCTNDFAC